MPSNCSLIQGVVLNARGQPVAGARVSWVQAPVAMPDVSLLTDSDGRFTLAAPVPGRYTLRCDSDHQGSAQQVLQARGQPLELKLTLKLAR